MIPGKCAANRSRTSRGLVLRSSGGSPEGKVLFRESLAAGFMEGYFRLAEQFRTQDDPAFCGLSSLTMVLNALAVDPGRPWKGPWRHYHESMLDCCEPLDVVREKGIVFKKLACLARCNGAKVVQNGPVAGGTVAGLRRAVKDACSEDGGGSPDRVVLASYDRRVLKQTGTGHFSPIGGYHPASDQVLLMDVARFKYPPHWVPLELLWEAMQSIDPVTGQPRGFLILARRPASLLQGCFTTAKGVYQDWPQVAAWVSELVGLGGAPPRHDVREASTVEAFVACMVDSMPKAVHDLLTTYSSQGNAARAEAADGGASHSEEGKCEASFCGLVQGTRAFKAVASMMHDDGSGGGGGGCGGGGSCGPLDAGLPPPPPGAGDRDGPEGGGACRCTARHTLSVLALACLHLLHDQWAAEGGLGGPGDGGGGGGGQGSPPSGCSSAAGRAGSGGAGGGPCEEEGDWSAVVGLFPDLRPELPEAVAREARHVADILLGLVEMEQVDCQGDCVANGRFR